MEKGNKLLVINENEKAMAICIKRDEDERRKLNLLNQNLKSFYKL